MGPTQAELHLAVKEVRRELALRRNAFPKWVAAGRLSHEEADRRIAAMQTVLEVMEFVLQASSDEEDPLAHLRD